MTAAVPVCQGPGVDRHAVPRRWLTGYLLVRAVVFTVLGLLLVIRPGETVRTLARFTGGVLVVLGAIDLVAAAVRGPGRSVRELVALRGLVTVGLGTVALLLTDATITVLAIVIGMQLVVGGGVSLLLGVWSRAETRAWRGMALRGALAAAVGVGAIFWPDKSVTALGIVLGVQWLLSGVVSTAVAVAIASRPRQAV